MHPLRDALTEAVTTAYWCGFREGLLVGILLTVGLYLLYRWRVSR